MSKDRQNYQYYTASPSFAQNLGIGFLCLFACILQTSPAFAQASLGDTISNMAEGFTNMEYW